MILQKIVMEEERDSFERKVPNQLGCRWDDLINSTWNRLPKGRGETMESRFLVEI